MYNVFWTFFQINKAHHILYCGFLVILYLYFYTKHNKTAQVVNIVKLTVYHIILGLYAAAESLLFFIAAASCSLK